MIVLISIIMISLVCSTAIIVISEVRNRDTSGVFYPHIWCMKHGLRFCEGYIGNGLGVAGNVWWGEDADGNEFVPGKDGEPVSLQAKGESQ